MNRRARTPALAAVVVLLATGLAGCNEQSKSCQFVSGEYGQCVIDSTGSPGPTELSFHITPGKSHGDFADNYLFKGAEDGVARFNATGGDLYECRQGETILVGMGQAECQVVEDDRLKVRIWVGNPPDASPQTDDGGIGWLGHVVAVMLLLMGVLFLAVMRSVNGGLGSVSKQVFGQQAGEHHGPDGEHHRTRGAPRRRTARAASSNWWIYVLPVMLLLAGAGLGLYLWVVEPLRRAGVW